MKSFCSSLIRDSRGATIVEYAVISCLIVVVCILSATTIGYWANQGFWTIELELEGGGSWTTSSRTGF